MNCLKVDLNVYTPKRYTSTTRIIWLIRKYRSHVTREIHTGTKKIVQSARYIALRVVSSLKEKRELEKRIVFHFICAKSPHAIPSRSCTLCSLDLSKAKLHCCWIQLQLFPHGSVSILVHYHFREKSSRRNDHGFLIILCHKVFITFLHAQNWHAAFQNHSNSYRIMWKITSNCRLQGNYLM